MRVLLARIARSELGMTTAEYAVGTVAVAGLGGVLIKILTSDWAKALFTSIFTSAFSFLFN